VVEVSSSTCPFFFPACLFFVKAGCEKMKMMFVALLLVISFCDGYEAPSVKALFVETFQKTPFERWIPTKNVTYAGSWSVSGAPVGFPQAIQGDESLWATQPYQHAAISTKFPDAIDPKEGKSFVIQYEFRAATKMWNCGGGYLKFFSDPKFECNSFSSNNQYKLMFGPDRCGDERKVHFIMSTGTGGNVVEHHLVDPPQPKLDDVTHLYQLELDLELETFSIYVDFKNVRNGSLYDSFEPPLVSQKEIVDPNAKKPEDWVSRFVCVLLLKWNKRIKTRISWM
jgi:calnexin